MNKYLFLTHIFPTNLSFIGWVLTHSHIAVNPSFKDVLCSKPKISIDFWNVGIECLTSCLPSKWVIFIPPNISDNTSDASLIEYSSIPPKLIISLKLQVTYSSFPKWF
jgi:hypothetical protein